MASFSEARFTMRIRADACFLSWTACFILQAVRLPISQALPYFPLDVAEPRLFLMC